MTEQRNDAVREQGAVAFMFTRSPSDGWRLVRADEVAHREMYRGQGWTETPLYATPQPHDEGLREALEKCRDQFRFYEASHAAKGNLDGDAKARTNCEFAEMCERALATTERGRG